MYLQILDTNRNAKIGTAILIAISFALLFVVCHRVNTKISLDDIEIRQPVREEKTSQASVVGNDSSGIDEDYSISEIIHLAIVCGGYSSTRGLYVLLKSILFHRTDVIHLHLFVDNISHRILQELLSSWLVDDLEVTFYNLTRYEKEVSWITNSHYSHRYGLMKLELISILADDENLKKVIILDTDMLVLGNIKYVWNEFKKFPTSHRERQRPIFGMVENQSDWYLGYGSTHLKFRWDVWPALGRGFNSGTILVDLESLRNDMNWRLIWRQEADIQLASLRSTTLADQDIFNSIFKSRSWLVHKLPCTLNLQLNDHSRLDKLCEISARFRILHWNSPRKLESTNPSARLLKNWYISFRNWDAKLLETNKPQNHTEQSGTESIESWLHRDEAREYCDKMRPRLNDKLRVYPYFMDLDFEASEWDVTYVVHLSMDRLQVLHELAHNWQGPISAAIYLHEQETDLLMSFLEASNNLSMRKNIGYHLVFRDHGFSYPINRMRNVALNHTLTPYVFLCDIDFLPSFGLHDYLKESISEIEKGHSTKMLKKALIVPAFESKEYKFNFPKDKQELKTQLNLGEVSAFRERIWPAGHRQTDFDRWKSSSDVYEVEWSRDFEPFIVTSRDVPRFDERFIGFGWNKVEHITQLAALGYKFLVVPEAFMIHKIHPPSFDIMTYRESIFYKICVRELRKAFLEELRTKYPKFMNEVYASSHHDDNEEEIYIKPGSIAIVRKKFIKYQAV